MSVSAVRDRLRNGSPVDIQAYCYCMRCDVDRSDGDLCRQHPIFFCLLLVVVVVLLPLPAVVRLTPMRTSR